ncbi:sulfate adenylyltransferase large subunit [Bradyrhizobium sp. JR3.5]
MDGLEAEREQGITIDVAYRFFTTSRRSFMVADTPGHEQYTRNMATGASNAQLAIILIDARKGVLVQTRRHSFICSLLGIRHIVLAVNKIDLVAYNKECFDRIVGDYLAFAAGLGFTSLVPIPISARYGDNVVDRSAHTNWYYGPCLLEHLESIDIQSGTASQAFRFPVQWVNRPNPDFRGYAGSVASGRISAGDEILVAASGRTTRVKRIVTQDGDLAGAEAGDAITITLEDEVDISRGDLLSRPGERPKVADQFAAYLIWMDKEPLAPGRNYVLRIGSQTVSGSIAAIRHRIDVNTCEHLAAGTLSPQRDRLLRCCDRAARGIRSLRCQSQDRIIYRHRSLHQSYGRCRHDCLSATAGHQYCQASAIRGQGAARRAQESETLRHLVHGPVWRGKVDNCQPR